jgi:chromosomal replication initiation ATPase DnaA
MGPNETELVSRYQNIHKRYYKPVERPKPPELSTAPDTQENERTAIAIEMAAMQNRIKDLETKNNKLSELGLMLQERVENLDHLDTAKELKRHGYYPQDKYLTVENVIKCVCVVEGIERAEIVGQRRNKAICLARHMVYYLAAKVTSRSLPFIGRMIGCRDHTTIIHGIRRIAKQRLTDMTLDSKLKMYEVALLETKSPPGEPDGEGKSTLV